MASCRNQRMPADLQRAFRAAKPKFPVLLTPDKASTLSHTSSVAKKCVWCWSSKAICKSHSTSFPAFITCATMVYLIKRNFDIMMTHLHVKVFRIYWNEKIGAIYWKDKMSSLPFAGALLSSIQGTPCHVVFLLYVCWHNGAFEVTLVEKPSLVLHHEKLFNRLEHKHDAPARLSWTDLHNQLMHDFGHPLTLFSFRD